MRPFANANAIGSGLVQGCGRGCLINLMLIFTKLELSLASTATRDKDILACDENAVLLWLALARASRFEDSRNVQRFCLE